MDDRKKYIRKYEKDIFKKMFPTILQHKKFKSVEDRRVHTDYPYLRALYGLIKYFDQSKPESFITAMIKSGALRPTDDCWVNKGLSNEITVLKFKYGSPSSKIYNSLNKGGGINGVLDTIISTSKGWTVLTEYGKALGYRPLIQMIRTPYDKMDVRLKGMADFAMDLIIKSSNGLISPYEISYPNYKFTGYVSRVLIGSGRKGLEELALSESLKSIFDKTLKESQE